MILNNLRKERVKKGISQLELSRLTRIAPSNICTIENGKQYPYSGWRKRIAKALGVAEKDVFPEEDAEQESRKAEVL